ncbi:hypothetical protein RIF29_25788 [Crotalaria pallida]|uniref:Uncharacterized protein n=1 Tax=Crotalaria pallida TaxID=3830 RepID=A0AAN9EMW4_CROPI
MEAPSVRSEFIGTEQYPFDHIKLPCTSSAYVRPPRSFLSQPSFSIQCLKPRLLPKPLSSRACCAELMLSELMWTQELIRAGSVELMIPLECSSYSSPFREYKLARVELFLLPFTARAAISRWELEELGKRGATGISEFV